MNKGVGDTRGCPLNFLRLREHNSSKLSWGSSSALTSFLSRRLDLADNLYRRDLFAHYGCVNAIEFSNDGYLLISGGDDRRVLLWNLEASMSENYKPTSMKEEHGSNIFCLAFDSTNSKIFSAGNDEQVIVHDVKTKEATNVFMHEEAIYSVSVNPYVDSVFASAGEDGQILVFDIRAPSSAEPLLLARSYDAYHAVQFHPMEPMFVVTANSKEGVLLWDVRKPRTPFIKYGEKRAPESSMCARFNSNGTQIIALRRRMPPVLFNTCSAMPVCEFDAELYYNSCTMKSCCFAGSRDEFVLSGSDDFNLYMWRIPDPSSDVSFIPEAQLVLKGHRSIVNQVRFNVHNFTIASSGVEKIVKLWSPVSVPGSHGTINGESADSYMTRRVYTHEDYIGLVLDSGQTVVSHDYSHGSTDEDPKMMAFFDSLVQREVEGWTTNSDVSDDDIDAPNGRQSSSSVPTSQSDTDSDSTWNPSPQHSFSPVRRRRTRLQAADSAPITDRRKAAQGSEWILKLIAKKRAQLKAAKKKRRNLKKKQKTRGRHFIRCFTSSRQYLYRPENNRAATSNRSNRAAPADLLRRRHAVAPYTMISLGHLEESDEDDTDEDAAESPANAGPNVFSPQVIISSSVSGASASSSVSNLDRKRNSCELRFWSSDSSTSDGDGATENCEGGKSTKKKRRSDVFTASSTKRGSSGIKGANSVNSMNSDIAYSSKYSVRTNQNNNRSDTGSSEKKISKGLTDKAISMDINNQSDAEGSDNNDTIMPISGISTDETGSLMFVTSQLEESNTNTNHDSFENNNTNNSISNISSNTNNSISNISSNTNNSISNISSNRNNSNCISNDNEDLSNSDLNFSSVLNHLKKRSRVGVSSLPEERRSSSSAPKNPLGSCNKLSFCDDDADIQLLPECPPSPCDEGTSAIPYGVNASTPDSGISVGEKGMEDSSSEQDRKDPKPSFRKKKIPEFRMKSYRSRRGDADGDDEERE